MRNLRTALIVQWVCFSVPMLGLLVAFAISRSNGLLAIVLLSGAFVIAVVWILFIPFYGRKLSWSYKFPLGLLCAMFLVILFAPIGIRSGILSGAVRARIEMFSTALDSYKKDVGAYPTTAQGLKALRVEPVGVTGWDGPYLPNDIQNDPWNHPYIYRFPGKTPGKPEIISYGADGKPGGEGENADIFSEAFQ